jgi:hypothetical protein
VNYYLNTTKLLERKNKLEKMFLSQQQLQVSLQVTVIATEEEEILYKIVVKAKVEKKNFKAEETVKAEATVKEEGIFKVEETIKADDIFTQEEIVKEEAIFKATVKAEDKCHTEIKAGVEDIISAEGETSVKLFAKDVTKLVIMQKIVELPLIKSPSFIKTQHSLQMIKMMMILNMCLPHLQHYIFPLIFKVIMKMLGF